MPQPGDWAAAIFMADIAGLVALWLSRPEAVVHPHAVLGYGTGDLTALYVAGVITFEDAIRLVHFKSTLCKALEGKGGGGARLLIVGLQEGLVHNLCKEAQESHGESEVCMISEFIFNAGFVVAGTKRALTTFRELSEKAGALQVSDPVSPAWHTPLMDALQVKLNKALDEVRPRMKSPRCNLYLSGRPVEAGTDPEVAYEIMREHFIAPVLWTSTVHTLVSQGIDGIYIMGGVSGSETDLKEFIKHISNRLWENTVEITL